MGGVEAVDGAEEDVVGEVVVGGLELGGEFVDLRCLCRVLLFQ